jgi:hypothetical protein
MLSLNIYIGIEYKLNSHSHLAFNQAHGLLKVLSFCLDAGFWQIEIDCNLLARVLASDALAKAGPSVCFEDYPPCLQSLIISELYHQ